MSVSRASQQTEASRPAVPARPSAPTEPHALLPSWFPPLFYLFLAALFLWRSTFTGEVFLPAGLLGHVAPWTAHAAGNALPPWNPLRWDGIAQFFPWRHFAAETVRAGRIPLWNPYQFCGTPFVANGQSAVFYPGNLLFTVLPTARAFGFSALLHLTFCGWFMYLLLRRLRCHDAAALLGGMVYAFSAWEVAWLQLPTFLATSCWFPLLLRQVHVLLTPQAVQSSILRGGSSVRSVSGLGAIVAMLLLAGHLQIAFYGLLAATLWTLGLLITRGPKNAARGPALCLSGLVLGLLLAAPQLLPTLELSRVSHRVGTPTAEGYKAYTEYALPPGGLAMLTLPDIFGNDHDPDNPYWGFYIKSVPNGPSIPVRHNLAETAAYLGIVPLLLSVLALLRGLRSGALDRRVLFFGGLALLALLLSLGTIVDAVFYFGIPGFGQSGSPARALVLWALSGAVLAGLGLDTLLRRPVTGKEIAAVVGGVVFLFALGIGLAAISIAIPPPGVPALNEALGRVGLGWARFFLALVGGAALLQVTSRIRSHNVSTADSSSAPSSLWPWNLPLPALGLLLLTVADLFLIGINANPTAPMEAVYPETPGIAFVRQHAGHERIFPVNQRWSLYKAPPVALPPNAATVYHLHDVQGYDSLLTGQYKAFANQFARPNALGLRDASPPEVGNMVFFQDPNTPLVPTTAALFALTPSPSSLAFMFTTPPPGAPIYDAEKEMAVYALPHPLARARLVAPSPQSADRPGPAPEWKEDTPTRVTIEVAPSSPSDLILADQFYPGWHAALDGREVPLARASLPSAPIFRVVAVPAGHHTVAFRYEPASFRVGLYLACFACLLIAVALTAFRERGPHPRPLPQF